MARSELIEGELKGIMSSSDLDATVIIPSYQRTNRLRRAIRSVLAQDLEPDRYEVIVVDSSTDDRNVRMVQELQSEARCALRCLTKDPEGPGPSRNLGAREARGSVLAFTDSDCVASPGWLRAGIAAFDRGVGLVQGRTLPEPNASPRPLSTFIRVERECFIYHAANVMYREAAFEQAGGFRADPHAKCDRPLGGEDVDLAWKVKRAGWSSRFAPDALVIHDVAPLTLWRWLYNKQNRAFPRLVREFPELRRFFFARYFYDGYHALVALGWMGAMLAFLSPWTLLLGVPYICVRLVEPTNSCKGIRRPARVLAHLTRDTISFVLLLIGSVRYRTLLL